MNIKIDNKLISKLIGILVGISNLYLAIIYLFSPVVYGLLNKVFVLPSLNKMYADFNITVKPSFMFSHIVLGIMMIMGVVSLFLGLNVLINTLKNKDSKYFKKAILVAIIFFILYGILIGVANLPIILSIYNLTSQF